MRHWLVVYLLQVKVFFVRPRRISTAAYHNAITASLWISRDRHDAITSATLAIQGHLRDTGDSNRKLWIIDTFTLAMRRGHLLCVQIGTSKRIVYQWETNVDKRDNQAPFGALKHHSIAPRVDLQPNEIMETTATPEEPLPPLCVVKLDVAVRKPSAYATSATSSSNSSSKSKVDASTFSILLSETQWKVLIPVANDTCRIPPVPQLMQRTPAHVVLAYEISKAPPVAKTSSSSSTGGGRKSTFNARRTTTMAADTEGSEDRAKRENRFEELYEGEREFSPYFYVVELAKFSETFWQRYDQTWWFDKTKTSVIDGMYKVVHCGFEPFAKVSTDAFAGCFRVAQCSLDSFGAYSEPLLLEPVTADETSSQPRVDSNSSAGLVNKLRSLQRSSSPPGPGNGYDDCSATLIESKARLQQLLVTIYAPTSKSFPHFEALFGFPNDEDVESVMRALELLKRDLGASNRELALLLLALRRLKTLGRKVRVRKLWVVTWIENLQLLERLVPELDCYPVELFAKVTTKLHELVQDMFSIVMALSSNGWLRQ